MLNGDQVAYEDNGTDKNYYTYDSDGSLVSMNLNGVEYYYIRNLQGDIIGLFDKNGTQVVSYTYDTWGKHDGKAELKDENGTIIQQGDIKGTLASTVGVKNPYRYRAYRFDTETGLYYLQSRYYNPEWSRFINEDEYIGQIGDLLSCNMFAYSLNNPVNLSDPNGSWFDSTLPSFGQVAAGMLGTIATVVTSPVVIGVALVAAAGTLAYAGYRYYKSSTAAEGAEHKPVSVGKQDSPYSHLEDPPHVASGKDFTPAQKKKIIDENKRRNGGEVKSDDPSDPYPNLVKPRKSTKGVTPPPNEWQIDHIIPKSKSGTNSYENARVISRYQNRLKWDN